jgi:hypothetical protein
MVTASAKGTGPSSFIVERHCTTIAISWGCVMRMAVIQLFVVTDFDALVGDDVARALMAPRVKRGMRG